MAQENDPEVPVVDWADITAALGAAGGPDETAARVAGGELLIVVPSVGVAMMFAAQLAMRLVGGDMTGGGARLVHTAGEVEEILARASDGWLDGGWLDGGDGLPALVVSFPGVTVAGAPAGATSPPCRVCGCTELRACPGGGCGWAAPGLCTACCKASYDEALRALLAGPPQGPGISDGQLAKQLLADAADAGRPVVRADLGVTVEAAGLGRWLVTWREQPGREPVMAPPCRRQDTQASAMSVTSRAAYDEPVSDAAEIDALRRWLNQAIAAADRLTTVQEDAELITALRRTLDQVTADAREIAAKLSAIRALCADESRRVPGADGEAVWVIDVMDIADGPAAYDRRHLWGDNVPCDDQACAWCHAGPAGRGDPASSQPLGGPPPAGSR